jgi:hypothetical protein
MTFIFSIVHTFLITPVLINLKMIESHFIQIDKIISASEAMKLVFIIKDRFPLLNLKNV